MSARCGCGGGVGGVDSHLLQLNLACLRGSTLFADSQLQSQPVAHCSLPITIPQLDLDQHQVQVPFPSTDVPIWQLDNLFLKRCGQRQSLRIQVKGTLLFHTIFHTIFHSIPASPFLIIKRERCVPLFCNCLKSITEKCYYDSVINRDSALCKLPGTIGTIGTSNFIPAVRWVQSDSLVGPAGQSQTKDTPYSPFHAIAPNDLNLDRH